MTTKTSNQEAAAKIMAATQPVESGGEATTADEKTKKMVKDSAGTSTTASTTTTTTAANSGDTRQAASNNTTSTAWDLETFLSNNMPEYFDDPKDVAKKLLEGGYTTKARLLMAREGNLGRAGLKPAEIDAILDWQEKQKSAIEPSVWQALGPSLLDHDIPKLVSVADKQGSKRKMFELDTEAETANRDRKKRRIWKASQKPVAVPVPAPGTKWYQGPTINSELFIRECTLDCFEIMWEVVEDERKEWLEQGFPRHVAFIVTGPPGLGKSWSSNTIVWQLLKKRQNIWFHSAAYHTLTTFVFEGNAKHPTISERPEGDVMKCKPPEGTWFLYDSVGGSSGTAGMIPFQEQGVGVPCVIFSSPKDTNYKQGIKPMQVGLVWHLWMPSWEKLELEAVMPSFYKEYGGGGAQKEFEEFFLALYDLWGGIPRRLAKYCATFRRSGRKAAQEDSEEDFESELLSLSRDLVAHGPVIAHEMLDNVGERGENQSLSRKVAPPSWLVAPIPIASEKGLYRSKTYKFCSRQAELRFLKYLEDKEADAVRKFCTEVFKVPGTTGILFERFAHFVLTRTESNNFRWKQYGRRGVCLPVMLPRCEDRKCKMTKDLRSFQREIAKCIEEDKCVVIDPISDQQDAIDMFVVFKQEGGRWCVLAMQDTISKTHSFHPVKILEYRQAAKRAFEAAMPTQNVRDDFFLHVVVVPKEDESKPFRLQGPTMTKLAEVRHVIEKFGEIGLIAPDRLETNWTVKKAKAAIKSAGLKNKSQLTGDPAKLAGAEVLLLNEARGKVEDLTWVLDGFLNG